MLVHSFKDLRNLNISTQKIQSGHIAKSATKEKKQLCRIHQWDGLDFVIAKDKLFPFQWHYEFLSSGFHLSFKKNAI